MIYESCKETFRELISSLFPVVPVSHAKPLAMQLLHFIKKIQHYIIINSGTTKMCVTQLSAEILNYGTE